MHHTIIPSHSVHLSLIKPNIELQGDLKTIHPYLEKGSKPKKLWKKTRVPVIYVQGRCVKI